MEVCFIGTCEGLWGEIDEERYDLVDLSGVEVRAQR